VIRVTCINRIEVYAYGQVAKSGVGVEKLTHRKMLEKLCNRKPYQRRSQFCQTSLGQPFVVGTGSIPFDDTANCHQAVADLLQAAVGDWVDFVFIPSPEVVAIYADHDEYATFYTRDGATLKHVASGLEKSGFDAVRDYTRGSWGASGGKFHPG